MSHAVRDTDDELVFDLGFLQDMHALQLKVQDMHALQLLAISQRQTHLGTLEES